MKKGLTDITIVLDRSFSMNPIRESTIHGVNKFIEEQQVIAGDAILSICLFDHEYDRLIHAQHIRTVQPLNEHSYQPRGDTSLFGAIGTAIAETGRRLSAIPEPERPEHVLILIVTDGEENHSRLAEWSQAHSQTSVKKAIEHQSGVYKWIFQYIGANQDAITNAGRLGIRATQAINYASNKIGTDKLYASMSSNVSALRSGASCSVDWSAEQRKEQDAAKNSAFTP